MWKTLGITLLLLFFVATCFAQTSYKGLTPGKSTRTEVERVLGRPVKSVSKTLIEYQSTTNVPLKLYVQYRDELPTAIVERIELTCFDDDELHDKCGPILNAIEELGTVLEDASASTIKQEGRVVIRHYGAPRFAVHTHIAKGVNAEQRLAYYSPQLYETVVVSKAAAPARSSARGRPSGGE
jgi:hypothetical protein